MYLNYANRQEFETAIARMSAGERVSVIKSEAELVAIKLKLTKNDRISKLNNRDVYSDSKGFLYSLDTQHGRWEKIDGKTGKHISEVYLHDLATVPNSYDKSGGHDLKVK